MTSKPKKAARPPIRIAPNNKDATPWGRVMLALMDIETDVASLDDIVAMTDLPPDTVEQCLADLVACGRVKQASHG